MKTNFIPRQFIWRTATILRLSNPIWANKPKLKRINRETSIKSVEYIVFTVKAVSPQLLPCPFIHSNNRDECVRSVYATYSDLSPVISMVHLIHENSMELVDSILENLGLIADDGCWVGCLKTGRSNSNRWKKDGGKILFESDYRLIKDGLCCDRLKAATSPGIRAVDKISD